MTVHGTLFTVVGSTDSRHDWLDLRRTGIGASDMPILFGESDWGSNLELLASKRGEEPQIEDDDSEAQELGRELEDAILRIVKRRAAVEYSQRLSKYLLRSVEHPWAIATPDAVTVDGEPVEVKNLAWGYDEEEWTNSISEKYRIQCNHQMLVMGAQRALFGALIWGSRVIWEWIPRDEMLIRRIIRAGSEFWQHVQDGTEPTSDGHENARKLLAKRATSTESVELYRGDIDDQLTAYAAAKSRLSRLRSEVKAAEKRRDSAADAIAQRMGSSRHAITADGWSFHWRKQERKGYTVEPKTIDQFVIKEPKQ